MSADNRPRRAIFLRMAGLAVILFVLANAGMALAYRGRALPHMFVGRLDIGGKSLNSLKAASSSDILPASLTLAHGSSQAARTPAAMGITVDSTASLKNLGAVHRWLPVLNLVGSHHVRLALHVNQQQFDAAGKSLARQLTSPALGKHIGLNGTTFAVKPARAGYRLDTSALLIPTLTALQQGTAHVSVPTVSIAAPKSTTANLASQIPGLQKELDAQVNFVYQGTAIRPSKADRSHWFAASGTSMAPNLSAVRPYILQMAKHLNITIANPDNLGLAATYALDKADARTFAVVPIGNSTIIRTYCTATKDVSDDVLADLDGKLAMTYNDARGWNDGGKIAFEQVASGCQYTVWMSAAKDMTTFGSICDDYYNCQVGAGVVLNYDRWTQATPPWNKTHGSIQDYRTLMIDHETGHRLGFYDNPTCPGHGQPAPVMMQQSIDLHGCVFNIWPRPYEFAQLDQMLDIGQTASVTNLR